MCDQCQKYMRRNEKRRQMGKLPKLLQDVNRH